MSPSLSHAELLMNAVVDGAATPAQRREFEAMADSDPALREEFEQANALAALLAALPQIEPPRDFARTIVAKVTVSGHNAPPLHQLPGEWRVNGLQADFARSIKFYKENFMSEVKRGFLSTTKSRVFAGGALAVVALAVISLQTNFPATGADTAGTIAPAERYRSGQQTDANVQSTGTAGTNSTTSTTPAQQGAADSTANASANRMLNAADKQANSQANRMLNAADSQANAQANRYMNQANSSAVDRTTANAADARAQGKADSQANSQANRMLNAADKQANSQANRMLNAADSQANAQANRYMNQADSQANAQANRTNWNQANSQANSQANAAANKSANAAADKAANAAADKAANKAANAVQN